MRSPLIVYVQKKLKSRIYIKTLIQLQIFFVNTVSFFQTFSSIIFGQKFSDCPLILQKALYRGNRFQVILPPSKRYIRYEHNSWCMFCKIYDCNHLNNIREFELSVMREAFQHLNISIKPKRASCCQVTLQNKRQSECKLHRLGVVACRSWLLSCCFLLRSENHFLKSRTLHS